MDIKVAAALSMTVIFASGTAACSHDAPGDALIGVREPGRVDAKADGKAFPLKIQKTHLGIPYGLRLL